MPQQKLTCKGRRLTQNQALLGPEYYGCCNTGRRPKMLYCGYSKRYIVGTELNVDALRLPVLRAINYRDTGYRFRLKGGIEGWAYKSRAAAGRKFDELCAVVVDYNERERARVREELENAKRGVFA